MMSFKEFLETTEFGKPLTVGGCNRCYSNAFKEFEAQKKAGNKPMYVHGEVFYWSKDDVKKFNKFGWPDERDPRKSGRGGLDHAWVEVNGKIIDATHFKYGQGDYVDLPSEPAAEHFDSVYYVPAYKTSTPETDERVARLRKLTESAYKEMTHWLVQDRDDFSIGVQLHGVKSDFVRIAQAKIAYEKRIKPWIKAVKHVLYDVLKFEHIHVEIIFAPVGKTTRGWAHENPDGTFYIEINSAYLTGAADLKSHDAVSTFIHEWAHIWLWTNETPEIRALLSGKVKELRQKHHGISENTPLGYALSEDNGDELWSYMVEFNSQISKDLLELFKQIRAAGSVAAAA